MEILICKELNPNISRSKVDRFLNYEWFSNLLNYIYQTQPSLREITAQFQQIEYKKVIEAIELGISNNFIERKNRRYYFKGPIIDSEFVTNCQLKFRDLVKKYQQILKTLQIQYQLTELELSIYGYGIFFGWYFPKRYVAKQDKVAIITDEIKSYYVFNHYQTKNYSWLAYSLLVGLQENWVDYFTHTTDKKYLNLRDLLGDVHPDYFLEHLLQLYKKLNRRGKLENPKSNIYLQAAVLMKQVQQDDLGYALKIPLINKAESIEEIFYQELDDIVKNTPKLSYFEYLIFYNMLLKDFPKFKQALVYIQK